MVDTNAMYVLWLRDVKRFFRAYSRIIGTMMMPIFFLLGLGLGLGSLVNLSTGGGYFEFIVPGIIGMSLLFTSVFSGAAILWDRQFGFLKEILVTPNSRASIAVGRVLGGTTTAMLQSLVVVIVALIVGFQMQLSALTLMSIVFMALTAATFIGLGLILGSIIKDYQGFGLVTSFFTMPLFFLSNGIFPLSVLPNYIKVITYFNPLSYGVDGLRRTLVGASAGTFPLWLDLVAMIISTVVMVGIASYAFNRTDVG